MYIDCCRILQCLLTGKMKFSFAQTKEKGKNNRYVICYFAANLSKAFRIRNKASSLHVDHVEAGLIVNGTSFLVLGCWETLGMELDRVNMNCFFQLEVRGAHFRDNNNF